MATNHRQIATQYRYGVSNAGPYVEAIGRCSCGHEDYHRADDTDRGKAFATESATVVQRRHREMSRGANAVEVRL